MNILIVYHRPPIPTSGGIAKITSTLVNNLRETGHKVWIMCYKNQNLKNCVSGLISVEFEESSSIEDKTKIVHNICLEKAIEIIIDQEPIDAYWVHQVLSNLKQIYNFKLISCFHNPIISQVRNIHYRKGYYLKKSHLEWIQTLLEKSIVRKLLLVAYCKKYRTKYQNIVNNSDKIVVLCKGMKEELLCMINRTNSDKVCVIPNFCDFENFTLKENEKKNLMIWCGNINFDIKRVDIAIQVWSKIESRLPGWNFIILGDGREMQEAQELIKSYNLKKCYIVGRKNPVDYYKKANFTLVTSSFESFSLVTLESQCFGSIPIVFNTFPAASILIDSQNGVLVEPYDVDKCADQIYNLAINKRAQCLMAAHAIEQSKKFSPERICTMWIDLLKGI